MKTINRTYQNPRLFLLQIFRYPSESRLIKQIILIVIIVTIFGPIIHKRAQSWNMKIGLVTPIAEKRSVSMATLVPPNPALLDKIQRGEVSFPEAKINPELAKASNIDQPLRVPHGPTGTWKALAILVSFSDKNASGNPTYFDTLLFNRTSGANSLHNYYSAVSYGQLDIVTITMPSALGWRQMPQTYAYYVNNENCTEYDSYPRNCQKLAEDAVAAVAPYVDFSQYDNNSDGYIDSIIIIHAGTGAEFTGNPSDAWSHKWQTRTVPIYNGVRIRSFTMQPEYWLNSGDMTIGVFAHELGHIFGLPDLYDTTRLPDGTNTTQGVGRWSLMSYGMWNGPIHSNHYLGDFPAFPDAWSRLQLGWSSVNDIFEETTQIIADAETNSSAIFRIKLIGGGSQEYFLLENRQKSGYDAYLPGDGLLIWHIDDAIPARVGGSINDYACYDRENWHCAYPNHFRVALEQADGLWNLESKNGLKNWGDSGDPWPGSKFNWSFTWTTTPSTSSYYTSDVTKMAVTNISNSSASMSVQFSTVPTPFNKTNPINGVTLQTPNIPLSWDISDGATNYEYCYDTTNNDICDTVWINAGSSSYVDLSGLSQGTKYYWQVRAILSSGGTFLREANGGWWNFTIATMPGIVNSSTRVSVASDGTQANGESCCYPSISADGRYVAFESAANNLVAGDTNYSFDIFVHDIQTGITKLISVASDGTRTNFDSSNPSISADGHFVAFKSVDPNLVIGDTNGSEDIFVHDLQTGKTTRVSVANDGSQGYGYSFLYGPSISANGRFVAFDTTSNLSAEDNNGVMDVFVHDRQTAITMLVSVDSNGTPGNNQSFDPFISADGRYVVFSSAASDLVEGDTNGMVDVFIHDRQTGETTLVSNSNNNSGNNGDFYYKATISANNRYVAFHTNRSDLVIGDTNGTIDTFVYDRQTEEITRVSVDSNGTQIIGDSGFPSISADGRYVAFVTEACHMADIFIHDRQTGITKLISITSDGTQGSLASAFPSISADGNLVAFVSWASNLVNEDTNGYADIFVSKQTNIIFLPLISK